MYYRALSLGVLQHTPQISCHLCNLVFWITVFVNFLLRKYCKYLNNIDMVLLRICSYMYGDFLEYYFKLQFSAFWSMHEKTSS